MLKALGPSARYVRGESHLAIGSVRPGTTSTTWLVSLARPVTGSFPQGRNSPFTRTASSARLTTSRYSTAGRLLRMTVAMRKVITKTRRNGSGRRSRRSSCRSSRLTSSWTRTRTGRTSRGSPRSPD